MTDYALLPLTTSVQRVADGAVIPSNPDNADWCAYQKWLSEGNVATAVPAAPAPAARFTFLDFIALFTTAEQAAIVGSSDGQVKMFLLMAAGATYVDLSDARTKQAIGYLESIGLITADREAVILAAPAAAAS